MPKKVFKHLKRRNIRIMNSTHTKVITFAIILAVLLYPVLGGESGPFQAGILESPNANDSLEHENKRLLFATKVFTSNGNLYADASSYLGEKLPLATFKFIDQGTKNPLLLNLSALENTETASTIQEGHKRTVKLLDNHFYRIEVYDEEKALISYLNFYVQENIADSGEPPISFDNINVSNLQTTLIKKKGSTLKWNGPNSTLFYEVTLTLGSESTVYKVVKPELHLDWGGKVKDGNYAYKVCRYDSNGYAQTSCPSGKLIVATKTTTDNVEVSPASGIYEKGTVVTIKDTGDRTQTFYWTIIDDVESPPQKLKNKDGETITLNTNTKLIYYTKNKDTGKSSKQKKEIYLVQGAVAKAAAPVAAQKSKTPQGADSKAAKKAVLSRKVKLLENRLKSSSIGEAERKIFEGRIRLIKIILERE
jgi:hypothetical protein